MAAILSANGELNPISSWEINMNTLLNFLQLGIRGIIERIFWSSSIAVFGSDAPMSIPIKMLLQIPTQSMELVNWQAKNGVNITLKNLVWM